VRTLQSTIATCAVALLCACANQSAGPAGWQLQSGTGNAWTSGGQQYVYTKKAFAGTLQDLASQEAVNVVLQHRGSKFQRSVPLTGCPGHAAIASFRFADGTVLQEGFAVANGQAFTIAYSRPSGAAVDPAAADAMQRTLCGTVG